MGSYTSDFNSDVESVDVQRKTPEIADYDPIAVTIKLDTRDDKVLASVQSLLGAFFCASSPDNKGKYRSDCIKEYTASEFEDKFGGKYVTMAQFHADAKKAYELLKNREKYFVGDDDINIQKALDFVDRYEEINRDFADYRAQYIKDVQINNPQSKAAAAEYTPVLPSLIK